MAQFVLINTVIVATTKWLAGAVIDDTKFPTAPIIAAGGVLYPAGNTIIDAAAVSAQSLRKNKAVDDQALNDLMGTAFTNAAKALQDFEHAAKGTNLTDADATILTSQGRWRTLPAATLTAARVLTLGVSDGPKAGDQIELTRLDATANTYAVANGGGGGGTLITTVASKTSSAKFQFNAAGAWELKSFGVGS